MTDPPAKVALPPEETLQPEPALIEKPEPAPPEVQEGVVSREVASQENTSTREDSSPPESAGEDQTTVTLGDKHLIPSDSVGDGAQVSELDVSNSYQEPKVPPPDPQPARSKGTRTPRRYRPPVRTPPGPSVTPIETANGGGQTERHRALSVDVRLLFERGGFCRVTLLPRRTADLPAELAVHNSEASSPLIAQQDEWYQDVVPNELGNRLREGIEWQATVSDGREVAWSLAGRDIYVLAHHDRLNGFVAVPRLTIGADHVILCTAELLPEVREAIELAGSSRGVELTAANGLPNGWVGLRGVVPRKPVPPSSDGNILDALRPLAELEITLDGGIRIERQAWLHGYPPRIRLLGDLGAAGPVLIDGCEASTSAEGNYETPGWDTLGEHKAWCTGITRSYAIQEGLEAWQPWDAYTWSHGDFAGGDSTQRSICGVVVLSSARSQTERRTIIVPATNSIIVGAKPGEIEACSVRRDIRADLCIAHPEFEPVWAIPADPTRCDKRTIRVLLIGALCSPEVMNGHRPQRRTHDAESVRAWCAAIRAVSRKGLKTEPFDGAVRDCWNLYRKRAKDLWRGLR